MAKRLPTLLPRLAALVVVGLATTATLTYAAGRNLDTPKRSDAVLTSSAAAPVVVPDVQKEAFVFAKGALEDAGFAWRVSGSVQGYASNTVVSQSPAPGTKLYDTGAPLVTLTLARNSSYPQAGESENTSPYGATEVEAAPSQGLGPASPAPTRSPVSAVPASPKPAAAAPRHKAAPHKAAPHKAVPHKTAPGTSAALAPWPKSRPAAFVVPGGRREPLDEMPLTNRAALLSDWLSGHREKTPANLSHWLYQNEWIVAGAKLGWWHGAQALTALIVVDRRTESLWGVGAQSAFLARQALEEVQSRSK